MLKFCSKECVSICDACVNFSPNLDEEGMDMSIGFCFCINEMVERSDGHDCKYFICFRAEINES